MKISLNTIRAFNERYKTTSDITPGGVDALVEKIGSQLGEVESVENLGEIYQGVVVAKVVNCSDHPNADRLHVCSIDDGGITPDVNRDENGHVQVVCGAPNVREGLLVAWLPPGSTVPESVGKDPFVLEARELRGVVSNGMLASPKELALGDGHDGILELDDSAKPGDDFAKAYGLDDYIIDIENKMFTHRPDCFGFLGVSRELAGIQGLPFKSPQWYQLSPEVPDVEAPVLPLQIRNEIPSLVPRFVAIAMADVKVGPSPLWLQIELAKQGLRSINNIVDYTNYFMLETGQPLHAYDYDKVKSMDGGDTATIVVRQPREKESLALLNGKTITPRQEAIMIATDSKLIGVGGVMGGADTEVDDSTQNIIIECATFDMYSVRRTSMAHGLFTDAVTRFNKGQSPLQNVAVIAKIVDEIRTYAGGKVASKLMDVNQVEGRQWVYPPVPVTAEFINARLGLSLAVDDMKKLLENVECRVKIDGDTLTVAVPFWRTDIETREDIVEEVGRLFGFDHLPLELPKRSIKPVAKDELFELKSIVRSALARAGANEVLTYSFVHGDLLGKVGQDKSKAFSLSNALSPELQYYRLSLMPSLLEKVHANIKAGYAEFSLFEIGKAHEIGHVDKQGLPTAFDRVASVYAAQKGKSAAFYQAKEQLLYLLSQLGFDGSHDVTFEQLDASEADQATKYYEPGRAATVRIGGEVVGRVGEYRTSVRRALKLPEYCAGFELGLAPLLGRNANHNYAPLSRFPSVWQDITLKVAATQQFSELEQLVDKALVANAPEDSHVRLQALGIYQPKDDQAHKNITFRITITGRNRTLTDKEVSKTVDSVAAEGQSNLGAERV
ncbi:phenylalanine--tRNA ligase subunit beta [soil metagenome]